MTDRKKRPIKPVRAPRRGSVPDVPTVTNETPAPQPAEEADDEAIRRMLEAAYT
jgi:hypothetical protein